MPARTPEFQPAIFVLLAYAVAPAGAIGILWLVTSIYEGVFGWYTIEDDMKALPFLITAGGFFGLIVELFFVTPLLLTLRRYRWTWINIWWFASYGLAIGEAINVLLDSVLRHHWFGWGAVLQGVLVSGFTGMIAAIIFYLIAFRRAGAGESPALSPHESVT
jgi:hypothetical protein